MMSHQFWKNAPLKSSGPAVLFALRLKIASLISLSSGILPSDVLSSSVIQSVIQSIIERLMTGGARLDMDWKWLTAFLDTFWSPLIHLQLIFLILFIWCLLFFPSEWSENIWYYYPPLQTTWPMIFVWAKSLADLAIWYT